MKLHTGDTVVVISGKDKGKSGTIMRVLPEKNHVVIGGINMRTRHMKKTQQEPGRILRYEASMNASKVMVVDPKTKKPSRIGYLIKDGKKIRISKRSGEEVKKVRPPKQKKEKVETPAEGADAKEAKAKKPAKGKETVAKTSNQPFWKKLQFGSAAVESQGAPDESRSKQDHSIPSQNIPQKSSGRGS